MMGRLSILFSALQNLEDSAFPERVEKEEREHKEASTKHSRVAALGVNIDHFKKVAVEQHKCQICDRPLNNQELQNFLRFQVSCCCINHRLVVSALSLQLHFAL